MQKPKVRVTKNGPYVVTGSVPLAFQIITPNKYGQSWEWKEAGEFPVKSSYKLCRCGHSKDMPYCDDTHMEIKFDGTETATRSTYRDQAVGYDGPTLELGDAETFCAFARFCDPEGKIWSLIEQTDDPKKRELVIREATHCPAGRLVLVDKKTNTEIEPELPPSIGLVEDPVVGCSGPLWVRGGITIEAADGEQYETRNRVTLCRCGASSNKPFCDGSHASIMFRDGLEGEGDASES
ncbi:MAG: CDGSH iron-sulfur domain-containing protein [Gemmatimonadaceae bacterium]